MGRMVTRTQVPWRSEARRGARRPVVRRVAAVASAIGVGAAALALLPVATAGGAAAATGTVVSAESSAYGTVLMVGSGQFSNYTLYDFSRNTPSGCTTTVVTVMSHPISCTGAETDQVADWPALTTTGKPVAGPGVDRHLLGVVYRKDLGADQVTYAGQLLYLFDQKPDEFQGVNFMETVVPLPPWHGVWRLVSAKKGLPAVGPIAISTQTQPDGATVLAAAMFQGMGATPIIVYSYSLDTKDHSNCTGACALMWLPVLTTAPVQAGPGVTKSSVGEIHRSDGTVQLTFDGKPLYFYSAEVPQLSPTTGNPLDPATIGTGSGLAGPEHHGTFAVVAATP
jgi:predicted lipoprotein with Yx(FWY)xxD motif